MFSQTCTIRCEADVSRTNNMNPSFCDAIAILQTVSSRRIKHTINIIKSKHQILDQFTTNISTKISLRVLIFSEKYLRKFIHTK